MTAVEEIRRAAALIRERANAATPGPWAKPFHEFQTRGDEGWWINNGDTGMHEHAVAVVVEYNPKAQPDAEHIASWHPAVALAVADWLAWAGSGVHVDDRALAVAHAYLGDQP